MIRKEIQRKIYVTRITYKKLLIEEDKPYFSEIFNKEVFGLLDKNEVKLLLDKELGSNTYQLVDITNYRNNYKISLEKFVNNADLVDTKQLD